MEKAIYLEKSQIPAHLRGAYSGNKFGAIVTDKVTIHSDAGTWSGGSRDTYKAVRLDTGEAVQLSDHYSAPGDASRRDQTITLQPGIAVVRHSIFCGKDMGLEFYIHPDSAAKLLPAPCETLSPFEATVLRATAVYKSSYNGRNRYQMAMDDARHGYDKRMVLMTVEQWEAAKLSLVAKGMLNKAGAITVVGRNAAK